MIIQPANDWENPSMLGRNKRAAHVPLRSHHSLQSAARCTLHPELYQGAIKTLSDTSAASDVVKAEARALSSSLYPGGVGRPVDPTFSQLAWRFKLFAHPGSVPTDFQQAGYSDGDWERVGFVAVCRLSLRASDSQSPDQV